LGNEFGRDVSSPAAVAPQIDCLDIPRRCDVVEWSAPTKALFFRPMPAGLSAGLEGRLDAIERYLMSWLEWMG